MTAAVTSTRTAAQPRGVFSEVAVASVAKGLWVADAADVLQRV